MCVRGCATDREKERYRQRECSSFGSWRRSGYSRVLSPFHLQPLLYLPCPSPGIHAPLSTSISSSSSRGICLAAMPASTALTGARAKRRGPQRDAPGSLISHTAVRGIHSRTTTTPPLPPPPSQFRPRSHHPQPTLTPPHFLQDWTDPCEGSSVGEVAEEADYNSRMDRQAD